MIIRRAVVAAVATAAAMVVAPTSWATVPAPPTNYLQIETTDADASPGRLSGLQVITVDVLYLCQPTDTGTSGALRFPVHGHTNPGATAICDGTERRASHNRVAADEDVVSVTVTLHNDQEQVAADTADITVNPIVEPNTPSVPESLRAVAGSTTARISWVEPEDDGGSPVTGYRVYRAGQAFNLPASARSFTFRGLKNGTTYTLYLHARNDVGYSAEATVRVKPVGVPAAPRVTRATAGSERATLYWSPPANGGLAINGYRVYRAGKAYNVPASTRRLTFTGLRNGTTYTLYVRARNAKGYGPAAAAVVRPG